MKQCLTETRFITMAIITIMRFVVKGGGEKGTQMSLS